MGIEIVKEQDLERWEELVDEFSATLFLSAPFLEALRTEKMTPFYFRLVDGGETVGLASGLSIEPAKPFLKKLFRPMYAFSGSALKCHDAVVAGECVKALIDYAASEGYTHLVLKSRDYPHPVTIDDPRFREETRDEYVIALKRSWDEVDKGMRKSIGTQVRRATKLGLTFHHEDDPATFDVLVELLRKTKEIRLSKGYKDYNSFYASYLNERSVRKLMENGLVTMYSSRQGDRLVCVHLLLVRNRSVYGLLMGANPIAYKTKGINFNHFYTTKSLHEMGCHYENMSGVPRGEDGERLKYTKEALGAKAHKCWGGSTVHLNGRVLDCVTRLYRKMDDSFVKKIVYRLIAGGG